MEISKELLKKIQSENPRLITSEQVNKFLMDKLYPKTNTLPSSPYENLITEYLERVIEVGNWQISKKITQEDVKKALGIAIKSSTYSQILRKFRRNYFIKWLHSHSINTPEKFTYKHKLAFLSQCNIKYTSTEISEYLQEVFS